MYYAFGYIFIFLDDLIKKATAYRNFFLLIKNAEEENQKIINILKEINMVISIFENEE